MSVRRSLMPIALLVGVAAAGMNCSDPSPLGLESSPLAARRVGGTRLISCTLLPYDSVTQVIGPAGGVLVAGGHVLFVDSLALTSPVSITMVAPSQSVNVVRFRPEGLKFRNGVHGIGALVATSVDNCGVHPNQVLQVVNVSDSLNILSYSAAAVHWRLGSCREVQDVSGLAVGRRPAQAFLKLRRGLVELPCPWRLACPFAAL